MARMERRSPRRSGGNTVHGAELCNVMGLPPSERRYFMRHCRDAMARLCGLRAEDKALLTALDAAPHAECLPHQHVVRKPTVQRHLQ